MQSNASPWVRRILVFAIVGFIGATATLFGYLRARSGHHQGADAERYAHAQRDEGPPPVLWSVPDFALTDHRNRTVTPGALAGAPYIADFIFTQCTNVCPMMSARMVMLQRALQDTEVAYVSFSVDPAHDTPAVLAEYARRWKGSETRWSLLATSAADLKAIVAGFRVTAAPTTDPDNPIIHSNVFFLVDADGQVRGVYSSDDEAELASLVEDARGLSRSRTAAAPTPTGDLYVALGCAGCHDSARIAPPLDGLRGPRALADTNTVEADDAYVRRAILEPTREVVAGYLPIMPSYRGALSDAELDALVAELRTRAAMHAPAPAAPAVTVVIDPVCHMRVRTEPDAPHLTHEGTEVYFCAEACRDAFREDPRRYPLVPPP